MEISQIINEIKSNIDCQICFEKFIKLTNEQFYKLINDNKNILPKTFEDDNYCRCYEDRFECVKCKNIICERCYSNFNNHYFKPEEEWIGFYEAAGALDDNSIAEGIPGVDCPIICPFCRTKDYKIFYGNQIPYELLNEIKNGRLK
jgi:hypothetical protein